MPEVIGLRGLMPKDSETAKTVTTPPYDVIGHGTKLERFLNSESLMRSIILVENSKENLEKLEQEKKLIEDNEPCFYIYEQKWKDQDGVSKERLGILLAAEVSDPGEGKIRVHEDTFPDKVNRRIELLNEIGYSTDPIFCIAESKLTDGKLKELTRVSEILFEFTSDFKGLSDLDGIKNTIFRVPQESEEGKFIQESLKDVPFYLADGHHRYWAVLESGQKYFFSYVTGNSQILAYNRLINGDKSFEDIMDLLIISDIDEFKIPSKKGQCCVYTKKGTYTMIFDDIENDAVGKLDSSLLKKILFPLLGLDEIKIKDEKYFHYLPETQLSEIKKLVDNGKYSMAIALHPVSFEELKEVSDANLRMPEKSTYFYPKVLTGLFLYRH